MNDREEGRQRPKIDHVGIAVNSLETAVRRWTALLDDATVVEESLPSEGARVAFFGEGAGRIELLEPLGDDSAIARFLQRRGPGIHHVCVRVRDLDRALARAESNGAEAVEPRVRPGSGGARIAFLHPRTVDGVLVELREEPDDP